MRRPSTQSTGVLTTGEYRKRLLVAGLVGMILGSLLTLWGLIGLGRI
jgi:hypothetical protein